MYVGRTINSKQRDYEHKRDRGKNSSIVLKFSRINDTAIPEMEILETSLSLSASQEKEDEYIRTYKQQGFYVLNRARTGVGIGSVGAVHSKYSLKKFLTTSCNYQYIEDFAKENRLLYNAGVRKGWIKELEFMKRKIRKKNSLTEDLCISIARSFSSRNELCRKDSSVYAFLRKRDLLDLCFPHRKHLTKEYCLSRAKEVSCASELKRKYPSVSQAMYKKRWIKDCVWFVDRNRNRDSKYTKQLCAELIHQCRTISEFKSRWKGAYDVCRKKGWKDILPKSARRKEICKYTLNGEPLSKYRSITEGARECGISPTAICRSLKKEGATCGGFIWRYADEVGSPIIFQQDKHDQKQKEVNFETPSDGNTTLRSD